MDVVADAVDVQKTKNAVVAIMKDKNISLHLQL